MQSIQDQDISELNILCLRNLGDSYLQKEILEKYFECNELKINIFCRRESAQIFVDSKFKVFEINIIPSLRFLAKPHEVMAALKIIKNKNGVFITFFGDWLEIILLIFSRVKFFYPIWPKSHYLNKILRIPKFKNHIGVGVTIKSENLYQSFEEYISHLRSKYFNIEDFRCRQDSHHNIKNSDKFRKIVAFSPIGSTASKNLSPENIKIVVELCNSMNCLVIFLCTEGQKDFIMEFLNENDNVKFCTNIASGINCMESSTCYIGVDTFWTHVAIGKNIPILVFSGAIPAKNIYPDFANEITYGKLCKYYPCYNTAPCEKKINPFICIGSGMSDLVRMKVKSFITERIFIDADDPHDRA